MLNRIRLKRLRNQHKKGPTLETIKQNLTFEFGVIDKSKQTTLKTIERVGEWDLTDKDIVLLNIQSFITVYQNTKLSKEFNYAVFVKSIDYSSRIISLQFRSIDRENGDIDVKVNVLKLERLLRVCNSYVGYDLEETRFLQREILVKAKAALNDLRSSKN